MPTDAKPKPLTRANTWMAQTGGVDALTPELLESAQRSYDKWSGDKARHGFADYVGFVQNREQERRDTQPPEKECEIYEREYERYKAGELVVVNQQGHIDDLPAVNTTLGGPGMVLRSGRIHVQKECRGN